MGIACGQLAQGEVLTVILLLINSWAAAVLWVPKGIGATGNTNVRAARCPVRSAVRRAIHQLDGIARRSKHHCTLEWRCSRPLMLALRLWYLLLRH